MKILHLCILLIPSIVFAADYGGADKYPIQTRTGGSYILSVGGVDVAPTYDLQARADAAAVALSLKCGCEVSIRQPVLKYKTEWRKALSSSSSISSSKSSTASSISSSLVSSRSSSSANFINGYIEWESPHQRLDGSSVAIQSFIVWQLSHKDQSTYQFATLPASARKYDVNPMNGYLLIAAEDYNGIRSDFIPIFAREKI